MFVYSPRRLIAKLYASGNVIVGEVFSLYAAGAEPICGCDKEALFLNCAETNVAPDINTTKNIFFIAIEWSQL